MIIGGFLQSSVSDGRDLAQKVQTSAARLAESESQYSLLPVGETAIPVASAKHLFRTPSLGGQARGLATFLPASFLFDASWAAHARRFAKSCADQAFDLRRNLSRTNVVFTGTVTKKGRVKCELQRFGLRWRSWVDLRHVATRRANKRSSGALSAQAQQPWSMGTWWRAPLWVRQATSCIASRTPANADTRPLTAAGTRPEHNRIQTSRTVREVNLVRGFSRGTLPKTKDVPCSKRS